MPSDSAAPAVDPCSLIQQAEAEQLVGGKLGDPQPAGNPPVRCVWPTLPTGETRQVELDYGDGAKKSYDVDNTILHHKFTAVPGIGDQAFAEDDAIFFTKNGTWVAIHVVLLNDPAQNAAGLVTLAKIVAARV